MPSENWGKDVFAYISHARSFESDAACIPLFHIFLMHLNRRKLSSFSLFSQNIYYQSLLTSWTGEGKITKSSTFSKFTMNRFCSCKFHYATSPFSLQNNLSHWPHRKKLIWSTQKYIPLWECDHSVCPIFKDSALLFTSESIFHACPSISIVLKQALAVKKQKEVR